LPSAEILLEAQTLVHRDEGVVFRFGGIEQRAIIEVGPATLVDRVYPMSRQERAEGSGQVAVKQDPHGQLCGRRDQGLLGEFEDGDRVIPSDRGELVKKLVEGMPGLEIVDEGLNGDAGAGEDRRASEALRRGRNQRIW
jgi:hypothetical protein